MSGSYLYVYFMSFFKATSAAYSIKSHASRRHMFFYVYICLCVCLSQDL